MVPALLGLDRGGELRSITHCGDRGGLFKASCAIITSDLGKRE